MMLFKTYGYISMYPAIVLLAVREAWSLHEGVPPRVTFAAQMIACLWCSIVQIAVMRTGLLGAISDVLQPTQYQPDFSCPNGRCLLQRLRYLGKSLDLSVSSHLARMCSTMMWFWLAGAILPVIDLLRCIVPGPSLPSATSALLSFSAVAL